MIKKDVLRVQYQYIRDATRQAHLKLGHYVNSVWICDDCFRQTMASAADVSPNTPRADEADVC
ncbi:MAG: hypothetical protein WBZ36_19485 [Candidatus Nitrosopolaris sp.]